MNRRKVTLYILLSFGISWTVALVMYLAGIRYGSITSLIILALLYMPGPAWATFIIQKFIYKEGFKQYGWTYDYRSLKWILLYTPLIFLTLTLLTFAIIAIFGNTHLIEQFGQISFSQENFDLHLRELASATIDMGNKEIPSIPPLMMFGAILVQGTIAGSTINLPFMFGEEFGWRGLMLSETRRMGFLKASIFIGLVWGIWHLPIILMGHNYPNHRYFGVIMMCFFTMSVAPIFSYIRIKTRSILGPCVLHGMINTTGPMYILFLANRNELYSFVAGWAGVIASIILIIGIFMFDKKFVEEYRTIE